MRNHNISFNENGEVRLATKQGKPQKPKDTAHQQELIDICLNCKKKVCHGCGHDKRFKKHKNSTKEELS